MGQLHQARQEAVVRQLVLAIEGVCGGGEDRPGRISNVSFTSPKKQVTNSPMSMLSFPRATRERKRMSL